MVVRKSKLAAFVADCLLQIQAGRADALHNLIQTDPFEVSFSVDVIDDTEPEIEGDVTEQVQPESTTTTTKAASTSTQTQTKDAVTSTEQQITTPGQEQTTQAFGRDSRTDVEYTG